MTNTTRNSRAIVSDSIAMFISRRRKSGNGTTMARAEMQLAGGGGQRQLWSKTNGWMDDWEPQKAESQNIKKM